MVRAYQQVDQTQPDGSTVSVWTMVKYVLTDSTGAYSLAVYNDRPTMVEVLSTFNGGSGVVNLVADPNGINSPVSVLNRVHYALRKAADGSAPANVNVPNSMLTGSTVVNFSVGVNDAWWVTNPTLSLVNSGKEPLAPFLGQAVLETTLPGRTDGQGSGSRILGIGDTIASFVAAYGTATAGVTLDLHYWPSRSEARGSFIEYHRELFPQAYDPTTGKYHYFGSLRGDATNDDAWDEGIILPMLARNALYNSSNLLPGTSNSRTFSVPANLLYPVSTPLTDLSPDLARIEGLADAMAAAVLKSPYLADTQGTGLAVSPVVDIRNVKALTPAQKSPYSAPALRAFAWEIILKANSLPTPGVPTDWAKINPLATGRFFAAPTALTSLLSNGSSRDFEPLNIYSQLNRIREFTSGTDTVDLNTIFTDAILTNLAAPFGIPWPRPVTGPYASFASDWGADPTSPFPAAALSMAKAAQVKMPYFSAPNVIDYQPAYPNLSSGEVFYSGFTLNADKRCVLSATIAPALAAGSTIEVDLPTLPRTFAFTGTGGATDAIVIPGANTTPIFHPVRIRVINATAIQPDVAVTLALTPAP
jgi:hypothetical protein